jgi:hypothetical protein
MNHSLSDVQSGSSACFLCLNLSFTDVESSFASGYAHGGTQEELQSVADRNLSISQLYLLSDLKSSLIEGVSGTRIKKKRH